MVRRHRLLETYLVSELGYGWDEVHDEAEVLEHAVSDRLMKPIDAARHSSRDPHGDPIPPRRRDRQPQVCLLADMRDGETGVIAGSPTPTRRCCASTKSASRWTGWCASPTNGSFARTTIITVDDVGPPSPSVT